MIDWGSIPDWINVLIALLAFIGFLVVERERLPVSKMSPKRYGKTTQETPTDHFPEQSLHSAEHNVVLRAELYIRILMGVVLGLALNPIYAWVFSGLVSKEKMVDYSDVLSVQDLASAISAIVLSTLLSLAYVRLSRSLVSIFVHWVERSFIAFLAFSLIHMFVYVPWNPDGTYALEKIEYVAFINVIVCIIMLLLIGFPSTPIDWLFELDAKKKRKIT